MDIIVQYLLMVKQEVENLIQLKASTILNKDYYNQFCKIYLKKKQSFKNKKLKHKFKFHIQKYIMRN